VATRSYRNGNADESPADSASAGGLPHLGRGRLVGDLTLLIAAMEEAVGQGSLSALVQYDTAFHDAITRRAGNRLYRDLLGHVAQLSIDSRRISLSVPGPCR
jgi:DNA-binding GntR family transcriptional regulator